MPVPGSERGVDGLAGGESLLSQRQSEGLKEGLRKDTTAEFQSNRNSVALLAAKAVRCSLNVDPTGSATACNNAALLRVPAALPKVTTACNSLYTEVAICTVDTYRCGV